MDATKHELIVVQTVRPMRSAFPLGPLPNRPRFGNVHSGGWGRVDPDAARLVLHVDLGVRTVPVPFRQRRYEP